MIENLSIRAQAILAGHWGFAPGLQLTLNNVESRLTEENSAAMSELIMAGLVKAEKADNGYAESMTYTLTNEGRAARFQKSMAWLRDNGNFSLTERIERP